MRFPQWLKTINRWTAIAAGVIFLIIGILTTFEGIARGIFSRPTIWSMNISQYILLWGIFLAASYTLQEKGHTAVEFFRDEIGNRYSMKLRRVLTTAGYTMASVYVIVMLWGSVKTFLHSAAIDRLTLGVIQVPLTWLYAGMVIGSIFMLLTLVYIIADLISGGDYYV